MQRFGFSAAHWQLTGLSLEMAVPSSFGVSHGDSTQRACKGAGHQHFWHSFALAMLRKRAVRGG